MHSHQLTPRPHRRGIRQEPLSRRGVASRMADRHGLFDGSSGQHAALLFCGIRGRDSARIGRLASITARTAPIAPAYLHEAHNDGAALEYAKSRSISLVKQKANLAPKTIKNLYGLNTALLCLLIVNLFYRKIRSDSINI